MTAELLVREVRQISPIRMSEHGIDIRKEVGNTAVNRENIGVSSQ